MAVLQEYKCPCCDGAIAFDAGAQKLKCPFCDTEFDVAVLDTYTGEVESKDRDEMEWDSSESKNWYDEDGMHGYVCSSCGGEIICDATTAATACPYCGSPVVMTDNVSGVLKPDCIIPFKIDKDAAVEALKKHYQGKRLLPKAFKSENHLREVKGVYVPVWLFDATAEGSVSYDATRSRAWSDSRYYYTETSHYLVSRDGSLEFERIPVDGSSKMDNALMESIEPFDHSEAVEFNSAYLAGYLADKYDVGAEISIERANERIKKSLEQAFMETVNNYDSVNLKGSRASLPKSKARYALYPVWILSTKWKEQNYIFAVNGQSGRMAGDLPADKGILNRWRAGIALTVAAAVFAISYLVWLI
ncbi:MAG: hypothetical protein E7420_08080 [Ruminococcaceae bacterium]|nr:hypothetical protein [Oscillospiraceae bacterium]